VREEETCPSELGRGKHTSQGKGGGTCPAGLGRVKHASKGKEGGNVNWLG